jgi:hypothetical protein
MSTTEIYGELEKLWETFKAEHNSSKKVSKGRARKALGEMKKLITPYRAASNAEGKA